MSDQEAQETQESNATPSQIRDIENGIFNMVITLVQTLSQANPPEKSRAYVIRYLERLSAGLNMAGEEEGESTDD